MRSMLRPSPQQKETTEKGDCYHACQNLRRLFVSALGLESPLGCRERDVYLRWEPFQLMLGNPGFPRKIRLLEPVHYHWFVHHHTRSVPPAKSDRLYNPQ